MQKVFNVAFCGAGGIVRGNHLVNLQQRTDRFRVVGFFDVDPEKARELAGDKFKAYQTYDQLLADGQVDLVVIATKPLRTHFPTTKAALEAGKHVLLEKPMASTTEECDELIALADNNGLILTIHHNRRLDLDFLALRDVLDKGVLGELRYIENRHISGNYEPKDIVDWGSHLVEQSLTLNRSPLREVSAFLCHPDKGPAQGGYMEATFRFEKLPVVRVSMLPRPQEYLLNGTPPAPRFYAVGTKGAFVQRTLEDPRDMINATQNFDKVKPEYAVPDFLEIRRKGFYDYLYESLAQGAPLLVRPVEARNAIRAFELIAQSARENRTVEATGLVPVE